MISYITSLAERALPLSRAKGYPLLCCDPAQQSPYGSEALLGSNVHHRRLLHNSLEVHSFRTLCIKIQHRTSVGKDENSH